jgi:hypothetical protein
VVGYGGGINLASGVLRQPVHGEVAGFYGGEVAGEASGRDRGKEIVFCARSEVVKFVNNLNLTLRY